MPSIIYSEAIFMSFWTTIFSIVSALAVALCAASTAGSGISRLQVLRGLGICISFAVVVVSRLWLVGLQRAQLNAAGEASIDVCCRPHPLCCFDEGIRGDDEFGEHGSCLSVRGGSIPPCWLVTLRSSGGVVSRQPAP